MEFTAEVGSKGPIEIPSIKPTEDFSITQTKSFQSKSKGNEKRIPGLQVSLRKKERRNLDLYYSASPKKGANNEFLMDDKFFREKFFPMIWAVISCSLPPQTSSLLYLLFGFKIALLNKNITQEQHDMFFELFIKQNNFIFWKLSAYFKDEETDPAYNLENVNIMEEMLSGYSSPYVTNLMSIMRYKTKYTGLVIIYWFI